MQGRGVGRRGRTRRRGAGDAAPRRGVIASRWAKGRAAAVRGGDPMWLGHKLPPLLDRTICLACASNSKKIKKKQKIATKKGVLPFQRNSVECTHW